jgi:hypothetical protein
LCKRTSLKEIRALVFVKVLVSATVWVLALWVLVLWVLVLATVWVQGSSRSLRRSARDPSFEFRLTHARCIAFGYLACSTPLVGWGQKLV